MSYKIKRKRRRPVKKKPNPVTADLDMTWRRTVEDIQRIIERIAARHHRRVDRVFDGWLQQVEAMLAMLSAHAAAVAQTGELAEDPPAIKALFDRIRETYPHLDPETNFAKAAGLLLESAAIGYFDVIGTVYMAINAGNQYAGQYFTPWHVAQLMAAFTVGDSGPALVIERLMAAADTLPGFLGDVNELDALVPPLRALKQGLYLLNWLLINPTERDSDLPSPTPYSDLTPPSGGTRPLPTNYPPRNPGGYYGGYTGAPTAPNPYPAAYHPYPNGNGMPKPYPVYGNGTALLEQPVSVLIHIDGREQWHTITRNACVVRTVSGQDTGLALTPAVETLADGRVIEDDHRWNVTHLGSGRQLNQTPFPNRDRAQALAAALLVIDWTRAVDDIPPAELSRAQAIIGGSYVQ